MPATSISGLSGSPAGRMLGNKLDSIPFSLYHVAVTLALGLVGFVEGYDLALSGTLLVLAKAPLQLTAPEVRWLAVAPIIMVVVGGFIAASISDHLNRKVIVQIGAIKRSISDAAAPVEQPFKYCY
jgi:MFS family permease